MAAVVTVGAFVGLGIREKRAFGYFSDFGRALIPTPDGLTPLPWLALTCGLLVHVLWIFLWGALFAALMFGQSRLRAAVGALLVSACLVFLVLSRWPATLGVIGRVTLTSPQQWFVILLIFSALFAGAHTRQVSAQ